MSVLAILFYYLLANKNHGYYIHNESLIFIKRDSFYIFDSSSISDKINDVNYDEFITICIKGINYMSTSNRMEERSNIEDDLNDIADKFVIMQILKNFGN